MSENHHSHVPPFFRMTVFRNMLLVIALLVTIYICFSGLLIAIVRNESRDTLDGVQVGFEEHTRWQGTLENGQSKWFVGFVRPDGWSFIHLPNDGRTIEQRCGYETFISIDAIVLTIGPDKKVSCQERRFPWL